VRKGQRPAAFQLQRHEPNSTREGVPQVLVRSRGRERTEEAFRNSKAISCLAENIFVIGLHSNFWGCDSQSHPRHRFWGKSIKGDRMNAEGIARRTKRNQCTLGEISPGVDAANLDDALLVAREFARALSIPDVQEGESLHDFERRVFNAWVNYDKFVGRNDTGGHSPCAGGGHAPYLNRETGELSPGFGRDYWVEYCGGFDECWQPLPGAKKQVDLGALPKLRKIKKPEESKPELKAAAAQALPAPIPQQQTDAINFAWIPPDAHRYLNGR
jgi:hypothetical protein